MSTNRKVERSISLGDLKADQLIEEKKKTAKIKPKKRSRRRRRATLADLRYIDILNTIPESEDEEKYEEFDLRRPDMRKQERNVELENAESMSENKNGLDLESERDDESECSECSDYSMETLEVKNAVSNYELAYDVDENENADIINRLNLRPSEDDMSDKVSFQCGGDSSGSHWQYLLEVENFSDETLNAIKNKIVPRRQSYSLDAGCVSELPSITKEQRKNSLLSMMSSPSDDANEKDTSSNSPKDSHITKHTTSVDKTPGNDSRTQNVLHSGFSQNAQSDKERLEQQRKRFSKQAPAFNNLTDTTTSVDKTPGNDSRTQNVPRSGFSQNAQSDEERLEQQRKRFSKQALASKIMRRRSTTSLLPFKNLTDTVDSTAATANSPLNSPQSSTEKLQRRFSSNTLASRILRKSITSLLPLSRTTDPTVKAHSVPGKNAETTQGNDKSTVPSSIHSTDVSKKNAEPLRIKTSVNDRKNVPTNSHATDESKNLVNALKQKVRATLRRRNSIASTRPWTGTKESSLKTLFDLRKSSKNGTADEDSEKTTRVSLPRSNVPPVDTEEKPTSTAISSKLENKQSVSISKPEKKRVERTKSASKLSTTKNDTSGLNSAPKTSQIDQTTNETKKETKTTTERATTTTAVKKAPLKKSLSLSSILTKKAPLPKNNVAKHPPSPTSQKKKIVTPQPTPKPPARSHTPDKKSQDMKKPGIAFGSKIASVKPQKPSVLPPNSRDPKRTVHSSGIKNSRQDKSAQISKHSLQDKNKNVAKEEQKSSKTGKTRENSISNITKSKNNADLATSPISSRSKRVAGNAKSSSKVNNKALPYTPKEQVTEKKNANAISEQNPTIKTTGQIQGKVQITEKVQITGKVHDKKSPASIPNNDGDFDKELDSFSLMLGELENSPSDPAFLGKQSSPVNKATEVVPTDKRFAALSERYNAIMAKFSTKEKKLQPNNGENKTIEKAIPKPSAPVLKVANTESNDSKSKDTTSSNMETSSLLSNGTNTDKTVENRTIESSSLSNFPNSETIMLTENATSLCFSQTTESSLFSTEDNIKKEDDVFKIQDITQRKTLQGMKALGEVAAPVNTNEARQQLTTLEIKRDSSLQRHNVEEIKTQTKQELLNKGGVHEMLREPLLVRKKSISCEKCQGVSNILSVDAENKSQYADKENDIQIRRSEVLQEQTRKMSDKLNKDNRVFPKTESLSGDRKRSVTPSPEEKNTGISLRRSSSFSLGSNDLTGRSYERMGSYTSLGRKGSLSTGKMNPPEINRQPPTRTTVIAQLMSRKLVQTRNQSIERAVFIRKSRIFEDIETQDVPSNMEQFNKYTWATI